MTPEELAEAASVSVRAQLAEGQKLADSRGLNVIDKLVDDGVSGYKAGKERKAFNRLIGLIDRGEIDVLVVRHAERAGRNDAQNSAIRLASARSGVRWFLTSGGELDLNRSGDRLNLQMQQAWAEHDSAVKSERLSSVYEQMRSEGRLRATTKTFGWQWEERKPERSMLAEPVEREAIQRAYSALLGLDKEFRPVMVNGTRKAGASLYSIIQSWNADPALATVRGAKGWSYASVRAVLLRASNAGLVTDGAGGWLSSADDDGKPLRGQWERLVPEAVYLEARALLTDKGRRTAPGRKSAYLASGIVKCGVCGAPLRSSTVQGTRSEAGMRIPIYRCVSKLAFVADPGVRHVSARITDHELATIDPATGGPRVSQGLDSAVRDAAVAAFAFGPVNLFPETSPDLTSAVYAELSEVESRLAEVGLALEDGAKYATVGPSLKRLEARKKSLTEALGQAAASEAQSAMLGDIRRGIHKPGRVESEAFAEYRAELGRRFDELPLAQQRELVRVLLDVTVLPLGPKQFGPRRWRIVHLVVTSLNDDAEPTTGPESAS